MLINNKEEFAKYIPTAGGYNSDPDNTDWSKLSPFVQESEVYIQNELLGQALYEYIAASADTRLTDAVRTVIACMAYNGAIPYVDLIQTPSGFGVVSNANVAPASKDRVNRLMDWTKIRTSEAVDALITLIFQTPEYNVEWKKFELYEYFTECLFMTAASLKRYCKNDVLRYNLDEQHAVLMSYQETVSHAISHEYMGDLINKRRNAALSIEDAAMIRSLMTVMGMLYRAETFSAHTLLATAVNTMVANLDKYPAYANSQAYRIKISEKYQNKKEHPTFFF